MFAYRFNTQDGEENCVTHAKADAHREVDFDRREYELIGAGHELEAAVALDQPSKVRKPTSEDVKVLVYLVCRKRYDARKRKEKDPDNRKAKTSGP